MKREFIGVVAVFLTVAGGYYVYRLPRVNELFSSAKERKAPPVRAKPVRTAREQPADRVPKGTGSRAVDPAQVTESKIGRALPLPEEPPPGAPPEPEDEEVLNQVSNADLSKILIRILAARKLASGISIGVSDDTVMVEGEVDSEEKKRQIIEILEKGREARRLDTSRLAVREADGR